MPDYEFLRKFCSESNGGDECVIKIMSVVKCKKGTINNPSPYYDRSLGIENEDDRYRLCSTKVFSFEYGKKYESVVEEDHVFEGQKEDYIPKKVKPDDSCPMLSQNLSTGNYCVEIVEPSIVQMPEYFEKTTGSEDVTLHPINESEFVENVKQWLPAPKHGSNEKPLFMQFSLKTVFCIENKTTGKYYLNKNNIFSRSGIVD